MDERDRDKERKRKARAASSDIEIRPIADPKRRARCQADIYDFLQTYFATKFCDPFTEDRRRMVEAILNATKIGRDQAIAAPRGEGKTTIAEAVIIYCLLFGILKFPVLVAATGPDAERILANIKYEFETNDLLAADFPEVCDPIRALEGAPQRCNMQTVAGKRTMMRWSGAFVVFPQVPGSLASGSVLMTRGLDGAIRGLRYRNVRPDLVVIDDPETRESVNSRIQTRDRRLKIEQDIGGLGGPGKTLARVILCTVMNRRCLSWEYTDPRIKHAWNGQRYRLLREKPAREDLWQEYMLARQDGMSSGKDLDGQGANEFYLANGPEMDAGAVLGNPYRFFRGKETSALQHCYNLIADRGWDNFATEYQNDPPEEEGPESKGLTAYLVEGRLNGLPQRLLPAETVALTAMCDVGKYACHWTVTAWLPGCSGLVVDHGIVEVHGTGTADDRPTVDRAILNALHRWREGLLAEPYTDAAGQARRIDLALVDSGDHSTAVYQFIKEVGGKPFVASKGIGTYRPGKASADRIVGNHWFISHQPKDGVWLYCLDSDYWKQFVHDRFLTPTFDEQGTLRSGSLSLWTPPKNQGPGPAGRPHHAFSRHIVAEEWREEFVAGKGMKRGWFKINKNNHFFDATYGCCAAADMLGVHLLAAPPAVVPTGPAPAKDRFTTPGGMPYLLTER